jgi:hypothetical protein
VIVVANSTPLVYLAALSDFDLLPQLFQTVLIPPAVYREVAVEGSALPVGRAVDSSLDRWLFVRELPTTARLSPPRAIHSGEFEVIVLAHEIRPDAVLLDDRAAVLWARDLGLTVLPTATIYTHAKRRGLIPAVRPKLDQLRQAGFWLKAADHQEILRLVGES